MRNTLLAGRQPTPETLARLLLGLYAAREFETTDPEYAGVLFDVDTSCGGSSSLSERSIAGASVIQ